MRDKVFSKKEFIASVTENVKTMYRKTLKEATQQEIYQAVSLAVKDVVMDATADNWKAAALHLYESVNPGLEVPLYPDIRKRFSH